MTFWERLFKNVGMFFHESVEAGKARGRAVVTPEQTPLKGRWPLFCTRSRVTRAGRRDVRSGAPVTRTALAARYRATRDRTERLCEPLAPEDYVVQSMPDASPTKWHLAHTTWFFETFVLAPHAAGLPAVPPAVRLPVQLLLRRRRRPRHAAAAARAAVAADASPRSTATARTSTSAMLALLERPTTPSSQRSPPLVELGLHHEQQHQELILTDLKHALRLNPLRPAYRAARRDGRARGAAAAGLGRATPAGVRWIGHDGDGFASTTRGRGTACSSQPFELAVAPGDQRRVPARSSTTAATTGRSSGSPTAGPRAQRDGWTAPLYWEQRRRRWSA